MIERLIRNNILSLKPYSSARNEYSGEGSVWLDANENPEALPGLVAELNRYPHPLQPALREKISAIRGVDPDSIFIGNGSDEGIDLLFRIFCNPGHDKALVFPPSYGMYGVSADINDAELIESPLDDTFNIDLSDALEKMKQNPKLTFICNPNNPSGNNQPPETIRQIVEASAGIVVVDEAYIDYCRENSVLEWVKEYPNLVVLQTLSKAWGLAGARIGLAFASPQIIGYMNRVKFPYNIGKPNMEAALAALGQADGMYQKVEKTITERKLLAQKLAGFQMVEKVFPSDANFLLVKFLDSKRAYNQLLQEGIIVRDRSNLPGCESCLRITIGTEQENLKLIETLMKLEA